MVRHPSSRHKETASLQAAESWAPRLSHVQTLQSHGAKDGNPAPLCCEPSSLLLWDGHPGPIPVSSWSHIPLHSSGTGTAPPRVSSATARAALPAALQRGKDNSHLRDLILGNQPWDPIARSKSVREAAPSPIQRCPSATTCPWIIPWGFGCQTGSYLARVSTSEVKGNDLYFRHMVFFNILDWA